MLRQIGGVNFTRERHGGATRTRSRSQVNAGTENKNEDDHRRGRGRWIGLNARYFPHPRVRRFHFNRGSSATCASSSQTPSVELPLSWPQDCCLEYTGVSCFGHARLHEEAHVSDAEHLVAGLLQAVSEHPGAVRAITGLRADVAVWSLSVGLWQFLHAGLALFHAHGELLELVDFSLTKPHRTK